ncbi:MAG: outer membrane protein assembly factor BamC [Rhodocyclaceae bacterium]
MLSGMLVAMTLAGCSGSLFERKEIDYKSAGKLPPLEIPPDLTQPGRDDRYAVPDTTVRGTATYSEYSAERSGGGAARVSSSVLPQAEKVRVERAGTQRWLVVDAAPDALWTPIKEFWQEAGFIINVEMPDAGIMETDWAENRAKIPQDFIRSTIGKVLDSLYSTSERDKFRTRLEPGAAPGTTEIYISHRGLSEVYPNEAKDTTVWQPRPPDPELEAEMLRRLMVKLGVADERSRALLAQGPRAERAAMQRGPDGAGALEVKEPFDRAWRRVGLALDRVGFTVEDRDRSQGLFFVRYVDPEADARTGKQDSGFLSKLMFWKSEKPADPKLQYRVQVVAAGEASTVRVLTREGGIDRSATAGKILNLLYEQLR